MSLGCSLDKYRTRRTGTPVLRRSTLIWIATAAAFMSCTSCGSSSQTVTAPLPLRCVVQAQADSTSFPSAGGSAKLRITTDRECTWSVKSDTEWLTLSTPAEGHGDGTVNFTAAANGDPSSRTGALTLNDQRVEIAQDGKPCEFRLSSDHEIMDSAGGDRTVRVSASSVQCGWTAEVDVPWMTIAAGRQGNGDGAVTIHVDVSGSAARTGALTIAGRVVQVEQRPTPVTECRYAVGATAFTLGGAGGSRDVPVTTSPGCAWAAESQVAWITVAGGSAGSGPGVVSFRVAATEGPARTGVLRVAGQVVTVGQSGGCSYTIDQPAYSAPASGGPGAISMQTSAGCDWTASASASWISITSGSSGSGSGRVEFNVASNAGPARTGSLTAGGQTVAITQANGCTYRIGLPDAVVPGAGGPTAVAVFTAAGCSWSSTSGAGWISISSPSGVGPGQLQLVVAPNPGQPRTGGGSVAGHTFTLKQASQCTYDLRPASLAYDASGGHGAVLVVASGPCTWTAESASDWIRVIADYSSGTGNGMLQLTVAQNPGAARTGIVNIAGQNYLVTQSAR